MNLAVKLWKDCPDKPLDFPDLWPWECREIGDATEYGSPGEYLIMSKAEYEDYVREMTPEKDAWENAPDTFTYKARVLLAKWFK